MHQQVHLLRPDGHELAHLAHMAAKVVVFSYYVIGVPVAILLAFKAGAGPRSTLSADGRREQLGHRHRRAPCMTGSHAARGLSR